MADPPNRPSEAQPGLTHIGLLGARLYVHCRIRAAVALAIAAGALFGVYVAEIELMLGPLLALAVFIFAYNVAPWTESRAFRRTRVTAEAYPQLLTMAHGAIVLDYLSLTAVVWLVGGFRSPFVIFYVLHVMVSALLLSRRSALIFTGLAYGLVLLLMLGEWTGLAPPRHPEGLGVATAPLEGRYVLVLLALYAVLFGLTCYLLVELTRMLRSGEERIQLANAELRRVAAQRRDFLHVAMHNLKAPIGAATMFVRNILDGLAGPVTEKQQDWLERSHKRLTGMTAFLSEMEALAHLETVIATEVFEPVDLAALLQELYEEWSDVAELEELGLVLAIDHAVPEVVGHRRLLREAVANYLSNALKYTPAGGHVELRLRYAPPVVRIEVSDDGPGIADEDKQRLFGEFVCVRKPGSPTAAVKGTGLGLSIVKRIVRAHDGAVGVEDRGGGGSVFTIELNPLLA